MLLHAKHFTLERDGEGSVASMPPRVVPSEIVSVIDRSFPWAAQASGMRSSGGPDFVQVFALSGVVELLDRLPDELLIFDEQAFAMFLVARAALRQMVRASATRPVAWPHFDDQNALWAIRKLIAHCPDEPPLATGSKELAFIDDEEWRGTLRLDIGAVEAALRNGEWKAATVLGGSLVEALLLWAVRQCDEDARKAATSIAAERLGRRLNPAKPESWDLVDHIEVARQLGKISETTATQARLAKDFRNLIHPGRERRQGMRSDRGTARSVVAAVDHVIRDLSEQANLRR
jgi:hypothetical protein